MCHKKDRKNAVLFSTHIQKNLDHKKSRFADLQHFNSDENKISNNNQLETSKSSYKKKDP